MQTGTAWRQRQTLYLDQHLGVQKIILDISQMDRDTGAFGEDGEDGEEVSHCG
jgi:hypothetical protein